MSTTGATGAKTGTKTKALCVATRCATLDQFVTTYHRFCDDTSFFVATTTMRPVGLETAFSIQLSDNTPVLRGLCTVLEAWSSPANQFKRPGIRLGIRRLTADSIDVFAKLKAARARNDNPFLDDADPSTETSSPISSPAESLPPAPATLGTTPPATIVPAQRTSAAASGVITSTTVPRNDSTLPTWATLRPPAKPAEPRTQTGSFAPSQTTKPLPIAAGASQAMAPIKVETLDGRFPALPRTQTAARAPQPAPVPLPVEPPRTQTATRAAGSAPSLENMLAHPATRVAQGSPEPPPVSSLPAQIVPPQTEPIAMPRTTTQHAAPLSSQAASQAASQAPSQTPSQTASEPPAIPRTTTPIPRITPPKRTPPPMPAMAAQSSTPAMAAQSSTPAMAAQSSTPAMAAQSSTPAMAAQSSTTDSGWADDAPTAGAVPNPLAAPGSAIGNAWSQEARSSEAVPEAIPAGKLRPGPSEAIRALLAKRATTPPAVPITPAPIAPQPPVVAAPQPPAVAAPQPLPVQEPATLTDTEPTSEGFALGQMDYAGPAPDMDTNVEPDPLALGQMTYERPAPPPALADEDRLQLGQMSYGSTGARETVPAFESNPAPAQPPAPQPSPPPVQAAQVPALPRTTTSNVVDGVAVPRTMTPHPLAGVALPRTLTPNPLAPATPRTTTANALAELAMPRTTTGMINAAIDGARVDDPNRTPGSEIVLPANPLQNLTDDMLTGFIECTLYEETASFIRDDGTEEGEEIAPAPPAMPRTTTGHPLMATYVVDEATGSFIGPIMQPGFAPPNAPMMAIAPQMAPITSQMPPITSQMVPLASQMPPLGPVTGRMHTPTSPPGFAPATGAMPAMTGSFPTPVPAMYPAPAPYPQDPTGPLPPIRATLHPAAAAAELANPRAFARPPVPRWLIVGASAFVALVVLVLIVVLIKKAGGSKDSDGSAPSKAGASVGDPRGASKSDAPEDEGAAGGAGFPTGSDEHSDKADILSANGLPVTGSGPCRLTVTTTPAGSLVAFDGQSVGASPIVVDATCAEHKVEIVHARYASATRTVSLEEHKPQTLEVTLARPTHAVTIATVPANATISIEGRPAGTTPTVVQVAGFYAVSITVEKKGYKTVHQKIYSKQSPDRVTVWLKKDP